MRIGVFLLISFALHATALNYPVFLQEPRAPDLVTVAIYEASGGRGDETDAGPNEETTKQPPSHRHAEPAKAPRRQILTTTAERPGDEKFDPTSLEAPAGSEAVAVASYELSGIETHIASGESLALAGNAAQEGAGSTGVAGGAGHGNRNGTETAEGWQTSRVGVGYAYSPKPHYPYSARQEGRQGTVLLAVLVDEEGQSQSLEVSRSSGVEALDKAAIEAVRRWRFNPARDGDKKVPSWVKIPIEFRLIDAK
jgi:protein TonB